MRANRPVRTAFAALVAAATLVSGCSDAEEDPVAQSTTTTAAPTTTASQLASPVLADLPEGMLLCDYSGDIPTYSQRTKALGANTESVDETWAQFQRAGAVESHLSAFVAFEEGCRARIGLAPGGQLQPGRKTFFSLIVRFPDAATAEAGYREDVFRQSRLAKVPGATSGDVTGLGPNSVVGVDETDVVAHQAVWQAGSYNVFLKSENFSNEEFTKVASAQRDRLAARTGPPT